MTTTTVVAALSWRGPARKAALVLEDVLRGRSTTRIARERALPENVVVLLRDAHGYPSTAALRTAAAQLIHLGQADITVDQSGGRVTPTPSAGRAAKPAAPMPGAGDEDALLLEVLVTDVHPDPDNARENVGDIRELAASIEAAGLLQPLVVRRHQGRLIVVAGHRRLAAVKHLGWQRVQVIVRAGMRPDDVLAAMLIENGQRADLDPVEEARALRRLKAQLGGISDAALGARIGRSQAHVSSRLAILSLPIDEQEMLRAGQMNLGDAVRRGRLASGKVGKPNSTGHPHLGVDHNLGRLARARCIRLGHKSKGRNSVGGVACGECWESVIRADERDQAHARSAQLGHCVTCGTEQQGAPA
ncbi:ParB/RepB/Spo0J family partition protein [Terrabacter terrigena]|uniref:ParB/RepB/Spo0J family partition protein n=1 Tax=Terrabacter terrigena TaxID=574718 RepID=A0ABW3MWU5_9MICO